MHRVSVGVMLSAGSISNLLLLLQILVCLHIFVLRLIDPVLSLYGHPVIR